MKLAQRMRAALKQRAKVKARRLTQRSDPKRVAHIQKLTARLEKIIYRNTHNEPCINIRIQDTIRLDKFVEALDPTKNAAQIRRLRELIHYNLVRYGLHQQMNRYGNRMEYRGASVPGPDKEAVELLYHKYATRDYMRAVALGHLSRK